MDKVIIKRSDWVRVDPTKGNINGTSLLVNDRGCKCCLGFGVIQLCNLTENDLYREEEDGYDDYDDAPNIEYECPSSIGIYKIGDKYKSKLEKLIKIEDDAVNINDEPKRHHIHETGDQERAIIDLFATVDIEVEFVD